MGEPLEAMMAEDSKPALSVRTFDSMLNDVLGGGGKARGVAEQVRHHCITIPSLMAVRTRLMLRRWCSNRCCSKGAYAMGYNLAIEYLADYEKTWMLDSFREVRDSPLASERNCLFLQPWALLGCPATMLTLVDAIRLYVAPQEEYHP